MSADDMCPICARSAAIWEAAKTADPQPWDEGMEERIDLIAQTYDPVDGTHQPLGPRKDYR